MYRAIIFVSALLFLNDLAMADVAKGEAAMEAKDYTTALSEFKKVASDPSAMSWIGYIYQDGLGVKKNLMTAFSWLEKSAKAGDPWGAHRLADYYAEGITTKQDLPTAFKWKGIAVDRGYIPALADLGRMYRYGSGVAQNSQKAIELYNRGVDAKDIDAMQELGHELYVGEITTIDYARARQMLSQAVGEGYTNRAAFELGYMYTNGQGGSLDLQTGVKYYNIAAKNGNEIAQNNLGYCYETGKGCVLNLNTALSWYKLSAENGYQLAKRNHGRLLALMEQQNRDYQREQEEVARAMKLMRTPGTLLCHSSDAELKDFRGYVLNNPIYETVKARSALSAYVEGSSGGKIQLRLASISATYLDGNKRGQSTVLEKFNSQWGTIFPGSVFWSEDYYWAPCK